MTERELSSQKTHTFFENLWQRGGPWSLERSEFEQSKYMCQLAMLGVRCCTRALELGCGAGWFTRLLTRIADKVVALAIAPTAIARAHDLGIDPKVADFRVASIMDYNPRDEGPWDLVVMSETIYYLGWLHPFFDIA